MSASQGWQQPPGDPPTSRTSNTVLAFLPHHPFSLSIFPPGAPPLRPFWRWLRDYSTFSDNIKVSRLRGDGTRRCWPYGWGGQLTVLSVKGFFSVASLASLLPFVPVCLSSVSDPCPYPSCLCLPLRTSFSRVPHLLVARVSLQRGILANYFKKLSLYFALALPFWYWYLNNKSG